MTLDRQLMELPMLGGLAEETWSKVVSPGSWLRLDNVQIDKAGQFRKRYGFDCVGYPLSIDTNSSIPVRYQPERFPDVATLRFTTPYGVATVGETLYASLFLDSPGPSPPYVATWSPALDRWEAKDSLPPFMARRETEVRSTREISCGGCVLISGVLWTAYQLSDELDPRVYIRGTDAVTGAVVQEPVFWFRCDATPARWTMIAAGGLVVAVYVTGTCFDYYCQATYAPATRVITRDEQIFAAPEDTACQQLSVCADPYSAAYYFTALGVSNAGNIRISRRNPVAAGAEVNTTTHTTGFRVPSLAICAGPSTGTDAGVYLSYSVDQGDLVGSTRIVRYAGSAALTTQWGWLHLDPNRAWSEIDNVYAEYAGANEGQCFTSGRAAPLGGEGTTLVYRPATGTSGALGQGIYQSAGYALRAARSFAWRGKVYLPVFLVETDGYSVESTSGALMHLTETNGIGGWTSTLVGSWSVGEYGSFGFRQEPSIVSIAPARTVGADGGDAFVLCTPSRAGVRQTRLDRVTISAPSQSLVAPPTVAQGLAVLPGALTSFFDGERVFEAGFLQRPTCLSVQQGYAGPQNLIGTHLWIAHWEHVDARGNVHYSPTSPPVPFDVTVVGSVVLTWVMNRTTRRAGISDLRDNGARLVVYRTRSGGAPPFYRLTTPTATIQSGVRSGAGPLENDPSDDTIQFEDNLNDSNMMALGYGFYPFDLAGAIPNAVLESGPVPPTLHLINHKQRLFGISGDNARELIYSRLFVKGEAPAFPSRFRIFVSDTEEGATALAGLDSNLLIFTLSRIYYVQGEGPADNGTNGSFTEPILFSNAIGCSDPRSVITTPGGVFFLAGTGGVHLVDQALNVSRVSGPVEDTLAFCKLVGVHLDTARGWVVFTMKAPDSNEALGLDNDGAVFLAYSYWTGVWTRWLVGGQDPSASALWKGKHVWSTTYSTDRGFVHVESAYPGDRYLNTGPGVGYYAPIWQTVQTPWLRVGALNGFQRVCRVLVLGRAVSSIGNVDRVEIVLHHDEEDDAVQVVTHELSESVGLPIVRAGVHVSRQKCASVRVTVRCQDGVSSLGTSLHAITLEIGVKKGTAKLSRLNKSSGGS